MALKNAFTGEPLMQTETTFEEKRKAGLALKAKHDQEMVAIGEPHPITGEYQMRPRSVGRVYDIPPDNGTYTADQVDQEGVDLVDVNKLMAAHDPSGKAFARAVAQGFQTDVGMYYDDFITAPQFQEAQDRFIHAQQQFELLPAEVRNRFENDPRRFLEFVHDPKTLDEQYKLGIRVKKVEPEKDATNKDVIKAIQESARASKKGAPRGDRDGEE